MIDMIKGFHNHFGNILILETLFDINPSTFREMDSYNLKFDRDISKLKFGKKIVPSKNRT